MKYDSLPHSGIDVKLDGLSVEIPPERHSLSGICAYLESMALRRQRILCSLIVDGEPLDLTQPSGRIKTFSSVEAETMGLSDVPVQLVKAALQQTIFVRDHVQAAVELVLINEVQSAKELWWELALALKEPLLTLSLLPEGICGPAEGQASLMQLRKWQLQQLGSVIEDVNKVCECDNPLLLSDVLEIRVLPWLQNLQDFLALWQQTITSGARSPRETVA